MSKLRRAFHLVSLLSLTLAIPAVAASAADGGTAAKKGKPTLADKTATKSAPAADAGAADAGTAVAAPDAGAKPAAAPDAGVRPAKGK